MQAVRRLRRRWIAAALASAAVSARAENVVRVESGGCDGGAPRLAASATIVSRGGKTFAVTSFNAVIPANAPEACHWIVESGGRRISARWHASRWDLGLALLAADLPARETEFGKGRPPARLALTGWSDGEPRSRMATILNARSARHFFSSIEFVYEAKAANPIEPSFAGGEARGDDGKLWGVVSNQYVEQQAAASARTSRASLSPAAPGAKIETPIVLPAAELAKWLDEASEGQTGLGRARPQDVAAGIERIAIEQLLFSADCPPATGGAKGREYPIGGSGDGFGIVGGPGNPNCRIDVELAAGERGTTDLGARRELFARLRAARTASPDLSIWFSYEREPILPFALRDVADFAQQLRAPERSFVYDTRQGSPRLATERPRLNRIADEMLRAILESRAPSKMRQAYLMARLLRGPSWSDVRTADMDAFLEECERGGAASLDVLQKAKQLYQEFRTPTDAIQ